MPQDAFTIKYVAKELSALLTGGKISKIVQPEKELLTFIIYSRKGNLKLEICLSAKGCRINISEGELSAPKIAPNFCMLLRKYLQNAQITEIAQIDGERIVYFDFDCTSEFELTKMRLYIELMGKYSNAVLVKEGVIVGALKTTSIGESTKRVLFSGVKYALPEPQDKIPPDDLSGLRQVFSRLSGDAAKFISDNVRGVCYSTALDIVQTYGEKPTADEAYDYLNGDDISPCVTYAGGLESDFKARAACPEKVSYPTVLEAQTAYYAAITAKAEFEERRRKLSSALASAIKKLEKRLAAIEQKLLDCSDSELVKLKGELITANIYSIKRGMDSFEAVNYYDEEGKKIRIDLDKSLSPADNAQRYYKRYAKLKRTEASVSEQGRETRQRLDYLNSINSSILSGECLADFEEIAEELKALGLLPDGRERKKEVKLSPFRSYIFEGFRILAGRNNLQNDRLLRSVAARDLWLHTQKYHSSHVVVIAEGREIPDGVLKVAAEICAYYSDGRGKDKVPVDYTARQNVKKPPKSHAGFVVYSDYKTALVQPNAHTELRED